MILFKLIKVCISVSTNAGNIPNTRSHHREYKGSCSYARDAHAFVSRMSFAHRVRIPAPRTFALAPALLLLQAVDQMLNLPLLSLDHTIVLSIPHMKAIANQTKTMQMNITQTTWRRVRNT